MAVYAVTYTYSDDVAARDEHRPVHRDFLRGLADEHWLIASGPYAGDPAAALLLVNATSAEEVAEVLDADPFQAHGIITARSIREWDVVIGGIGV